MRGPAKKLSREAELSGFYGFDCTGLPSSAKVGLWGNLPRVRAMRQLDVCEAVRAAMNPDDCEGFVERTTLGLTGDPAKAASAAVRYRYAVMVSKPQPSEG